MRTWYFSRGADGFELHVADASLPGSVLGWLVMLPDKEWWGKYGNLPFCYINPWRWTFRVGTGDHSLGTLWLRVGTRVDALATRLEHVRDVQVVPLGDEAVREMYPEEWEKFRVDDDEGEDGG